MDTLSSAAFAFAPKGRSLRDRAAPLRERNSSEFDGDGFYFGVVGEAVFAEFAADAGLLEAAERGGGVEDVIAIHPDGAGADAVGDGVGFGDVLGPDGGGEAVERFVGALDDFADVLEFENGHYRAEDFFLRNLHVVLHVGENGGLDKVALVANAIAAGDE